MDVRLAPPSSLLNHDDHSYARLHGRWLLLARGAWITVVVLTLAIFFGSLPVYLAQLHTRCVVTACVYQQLTAGQVQTIEGLGWSLDDYAALQVVLMLIIIAVALGVSTLIVWRRSDDRMAMLVAVWIVADAPMIATTSVMVSTSSWQVRNLGLFLFSFSLSLLVFLLFPTGQFAPRWMRWTLLVFLGVAALATFFPPIDVIPTIAVSNLTWLLALGEFVTVALAQVYRYRRVSTPLERQQTKWVVFGYAAPITLVVIGTVLALVPVLARRGSLYPLAVNEMGFLLGLTPLSFAFAMLRNRLWDIDAIINKALVYGLLTALLGLLYLGLILGLDNLVGVFTRQTDQPVVLVVSTLAIAALVLPVRRRLQALIDRRFYRGKYDAERTLATFSTVLRQEVDLTQVREQFLAVVQETMQPAHVSLWLRDPERHPIDHAYRLESQSQVLIGPHQD